MTTCPHSRDICENRWATEGQPCCDGCDHAQAAVSALRHAATGCRATSEGYVLDGFHLDECQSGDCRGCWPCEPRTQHGDLLQHCTARGKCSEHVPEDVLSCPRCVGKTREALAGIVDRVSNLPDESERMGVDSEAAVLNGPAIDTLADLEAYRHRQTSIAFGRIDGEVEGTGQHPLNVLGTWELMLREEYGPDSDERITVESAAAYLDGQLDRLAQDPEQDFPLFVREVAACLSHIEAVLHDQRGAERGAPCHLCPKPAPRLVLKRDDKDKTGASDRWKCPECRNTWTEAEYRQRVGDDYLKTSKKLTASQMQAKHRIKPGALRQWANRGKVRKRGRDESGRMLYDVDDALKLRDQEGADEKSA